MFTQDLYTHVWQHVQNSKKCEIIHHSASEWIKKCGTLIPWNII